MTFKEIKENLYKLQLGTEFPIYIKVEKEFIRIVQPILNNGKTFEEEDYFGKTFPQEIVIHKNTLKEVWKFLGKFLITENLK